MCYSFEEDMTTVGVNVTTDGEVFDLMRGVSKGAGLGLGVGVGVDRGSVLGGEAARRGSSFNRGNVGGLGLVHKPSLQVSNSLRMRKESVSISMSSKRA